MEGLSPHGDLRVSLEVPEVLKNAGCKPGCVPALTIIHEPLRYSGVLEQLNEVCLSEPALSGSNLWLIGLTVGELSCIIDP